MLQPRVAPPQINTGTYICNDQVLLEKLSRESIEAGGGGRKVEGVRISSHFFEVENPEDLKLLPRYSCCKYLKFISKVEKLAKTADIRCCHRLSDNWANVDTTFSN